ncbi:MAG: vanadium-dependent haloperoxidase [Phototrophicales bacterium]|nr:vanadium-dependent haloperoxidase [Phototrophicales bacterium]
MKHLAPLSTLLLCFMLLLGITSVQAQEDTLDFYSSTPVNELDPTPALEWIDLLYDRVWHELVSAPGAARLYGYGAVAFYTALLPGMPSNYSMGTQLRDFPDVPYPSEENELDWLSVLNGTMSTVLMEMFGKGSDETIRLISELRSRQKSARMDAVGFDIVENSLRYGDEVAETIIDWMNSDGYIETRGWAYELPTDNDSLWVITREGMQTVEPYWGSLRPFMLPYADSCAVYMDVPFSTDPNSTFYAQAMEVKTVGENLTPEQREIAEYWIDTPGQSGTPAGHWVMIVKDVALQRNLPLSTIAEMYVGVGIALADSFISAWSLKYQINLLRPITYINTYIDPRWRTYLESPGFPEYPSGHSVNSAAAARVLTRMFGAQHFTATNITPSGLVTRAFTSFEHAASEVAISRIYGGIHFRSAVENGVKQGNCIGDFIMDSIFFRSVPQGE